MCTVSGTSLIDLDILELSYLNQTGGCGLSTGTVGIKRQAAFVCV